MLIFRNSVNTFPYVSDKIDVVLPTISVPLGRYYRRLRIAPSGGDTPPTEQSSSAGIGSRSAHHTAYVKSNYTK